MYSLLILQHWKNLIYFLDAMEITLLTFLIPEIQSDWHLTEDEAASIGSAVFLGMLFGAYFWGIISDHFGSKILCI